MSCESLLDKIWGGRGVGGVGGGGGGGKGQERGFFISCSSTDNLEIIS